MSHPWCPGKPVWEWADLPCRYQERAKQLFKRCAEYLLAQGQPRHLADMRAYAALIERMESAGVFELVHFQEYDVIFQLSQARQFRRHDAIGRRIMAGTWPKGATPITEDEVAAVGSPMDAVA